MEGTHMKKTKPTKMLVSLTIAFALVLTLFTFAPVSVSAWGDAYSTISASDGHLKLSHVLSISLFALSNFFSNSDA